MIGMVSEVEICELVLVKANPTPRGKEGRPDGLPSRLMARRGCTSVAGWEGRR